MKPSQKYQSLLSQPGFEQDPAQQQSVALLDRLYEQLLKQPVSRARRSWFSRPSQPEAIRGLYFWGGVGRGKTLLMDLFYQ